MSILLAALDGGAIITGLLENSPFAALGCLFGWYMYSDIKSKKAELVEADKAKTALVERLINAQESRLISDGQFRSSLEKIIDKTGDIPTVIKEGLFRLEQNQVGMKADLTALKELSK